MTHNILAVADASRDALRSMLDVLRVIENDRSNVRVILLSFLSVLSEKDCKPLGPNTLLLLVQEENEIARSLKNHLAKMNISGSLQFITYPIWEDILEEMGNGNQDLIILQGRFLEIWGNGAEDLRINMHAINGPKCPVMVINQWEESSLC